MRVALDASPPRRAARRYPHYCRPNLWPTASLPELEGALKACGSLMVEVGLLLSAHCDKYVVARGAGEAAGRLRRTIAESRCGSAEQTVAWHGFHSLLSCFPS